MTPPRLNQHLVNIGLAASRRKADELIEQGKVEINGVLVTKLATRVGPTDQVTVGGKTGQSKTNIYIAYNKPRGEVCSRQSQDNSPTIFTSLPKNFSSLKIAGRLDKDSRGLVILSSDGQFVNDLSHPSKEKMKTYMVKLRSPITSTQLDKLNDGVMLKEGLSQMVARRIKPKILRIEMSEGKNRQIRRTLEKIGAEVIDLERVAIGNLVLHWPEGKFEFIKPESV